MFLALLAVDDGVVECGFFGVIRDFLYKFVVAFDSLDECLFHVGKCEVAEGYCLVQCLILLKKRVVMYLFAHCFSFFFLNGCKVTKYFCKRQIF